LQQVIEVLKWLETTRFAHFIAESGWFFQAALMLHIAAISVVVGMITVVDLRLMGLASTKSPVTDICRQALPWTWWAFALSAVTGAALFMAQPVKYFENFAFQMKFALMVFAGINMLVFQFVIYRAVAKWDCDAAVPLASKLAGAISLGCWIAIVAYGRWTAYYVL
jgi:hypothetical protein